jgi:hypothetical protein
VTREPASLDGGLSQRLRALGAVVPVAWLGGLLDPERSLAWLPRPAAPSPIDGRPTSPRRWALSVFHGLVASCGGRSDSARGRALVFDLADRVAAAGVLGRVARRPVPEDVQKSLWVRELLAGARPGEHAAACLLALEASGALLRTPAMVEQARWRLGPGVEATDAQAIGSAVADVVWHCHEDAGALLRAVAKQAARGGADE